jgi:hypothetical protein
MNLKRYFPKWVLICLGIEFLVMFVILLSDGALGLLAAFVCALITLPFGYIFIFVAVNFLSDLIDGFKGK